MEGTALVAQGMVDNATSVAEKDLALSWVRRANNLARMLDVPVAGRGAKGVAVSSVKTQLAALQDEMRDYLGSPDAP